MCQGIAIFADNKKVLYGKKSNSHSQSAKDLGINEDHYRHYEYHWWDSVFEIAHTDRTAEDILSSIDPKKSEKLARSLIKTHFNTQDKLARWLKNVPSEWDKLMEPEFKSLAVKVNPKLLIYQDKITQFKKDFKNNPEKYNPYQATKLPTKKSLKKLAQVRAQVRAQVWDQVWAQVWAQVGDQVWAQITGGT